MRKGLWLWIIAGWFWWLVLSVTQNYAFRLGTGAQSSWTNILRFALVEFVFWVVMTTVISYWAQRFPPEGAQRKRHIAVLLLLTVVTMLIHAAYRVPLNRFVYGGSHPWSWMMFGFYLMNNSLTDLWIVGTVVGIRQAIRSARRSQEREQELTKAHLEVLKGQLQPHFLFNALNSISGLMREDVEAADNVITSLSELLRTTLAVPGSEEVALRDELRVLDLYLAIERVRFQSRLKVLITAEPETLDCRVPGLLLQPVVENAVRHGVAKLDGPGLVEIRAKREAAELCLFILDNGPGIAKDSNGREGVGLANTRARLEKYYGSAQSFRYSNGNACGLSVEIRLPFQVLERPEEGGTCDETQNVDCRR